MLGGLIVVTTLLAGAIRLDQFILRWRAERLQSDIRSLELRKSTYADAHRVMDRWLDESKEGVCRPSWCDVDISLGNFMWRHGVFFVDHPRAFHTYLRLGGRYSWVLSTIRVREGIVWEKNIQLYVGSTSIQGPDGSRFDLTLIGRVGNNRLDWVSPQHPEYRFGGAGGGCSGCREGFVLFTPFADPADVRRLMDINFDCITRWHPCTEQADILPSAWKEVESEKLDGGNDNQEICTPAMIRVLSREAQHVPLATVIRLKRLSDGVEMTVRWDGEPSDSVFVHQSPEHTFTEPASVRFRKGDQLLVLDDGAYVVPATEENLKSARQGASEGRTVRIYPDYLPSFGSIQPPGIDIH